MAGYYVGIDYHSAVLAVCIMNKRGTVVEEFETTADHDGMDLIMKKMDGRDYRVMGEASGYSINLHNYLTGKGVRSDLVHPYQLKTITKSCKKTDRHDARELAKFLRLMDKGDISLSVSLIVRDEARDLRDLCRYREEKAAEKAGCLKRIGAYMRKHDLELEGGYDDFSTAKGQRMLREAFPDEYVLMSYLDDYVRQCAKCDEIDRMLESDRYSTKEVELLSSIPGIGRLTAVEIMSMIIDPGRFESADRMRSYFGMNVRVMDSGGKTIHGHVTKMGDPMMRTILGRVLNQFLIRHRDSNVVTYYNSHVAAKGKKMTRMACMNKLLDIIYAVLKRGTPYEDR